MTSREKKTYMYCLVPGCISTTRKMPDKIFFCVPRAVNERKKWCRIVRREGKLSPNGARYCCEDHFKVEEDAEDWIRFKIMKEAAGQTPFRLKLKEGVVPHLFDCQPDRKRTHSKPSRSAILKRNAKKAVQDAMNTYVPENGLTAIENMDTSSSIMTVADLLACPSSELENGETEKMDASTSTATIAEALSCFSPTNVIESPSSSCNITTGSESDASVHKTPSESTPQSSRFFMSSPHSSSFELSSPCGSSCYSQLNVDAGVQVRPSYRNVGIQISTLNFGISRGTSPTPPPVHIRAPTPPPQNDEPEHDSDTGSVWDHDDGPLDSSYHPDTSFGPSECEEADEVLEAELKEQFVQYNLQLMLRRSRRYLGIDPHNLFILSHLHKFTGHEQNKIMLVLRKVRMNEPNDVLGDIFGYCESTVATIIRSVLPCVASCLKTYIFWPKGEVIRSNLPIPFRANYSKVQSIIDCFEVEIEKPSNPTHQALTWSEYKKCNTMKYLISCTPDGFINFVSQGYGGRATDVEIVKHSGYLDKLPPNITVMADRGFKNIGTSLKEKKCSLERPPSCKAGEQMTEADVRQTKIIASLRIHVERVIKRVRDYSFLAAHSRFHHSMVNIVDHVTDIACALSNLQGSLIR